MCAPSTASFMPNAMRRKSLSRMNELFADGRPISKRDAAYASLERAHDERYGPLALLNVDPDLDALRADSRFGELLREGRLPVMIGVPARGRPHRILRSVLSRTNGSIRNPSPWIWPVLGSRATRVTP